MTYDKFRFVFCAAVMLAVPGTAVSAKAVKAEGGKGISSVASSASQNGKGGEKRQALGNDKTPPGWCVREIARPHSGSGISDEKSDECGPPPVSK